MADRVFAAKEIQEAADKAHAAVKAVYESFGAVDHHDFEGVTGTIQCIASMLGGESIAESEARETVQKCRQLLKDGFKAELADPGVLAAERQKLEIILTRENGGNPVSLEGDPHLENTILETKYREYDQGLSAFCKALGLDLRNEVAPSSDLGSGCAR